MNYLSFTTYARALAFMIEHKGIYHNMRCVRCKDCGRFVCRVYWQ